MGSTLQAEQEYKTERQGQGSTTAGGDRRQKRNEQPGADIDKGRLALQLEIEMNADRPVKPEIDERPQERDRGHNRQSHQDLSHAPLASRRQRRSFLPCLRRQDFGSPRLDICGQPLTRREYLSDCARQVNRAGPGIARAEFSLVIRRRRTDTRPPASPSGDDWLIS